MYCLFIAFYNIIQVLSFASATADTNKPPVFSVNSFMVANPFCLGLNNDYDKQ